MQRGSRARRAGRRQAPPLSPRNGRGGVVDACAAGSGPDTAAGVRRGSTRPRGAGAEGVSRPPWLHRSETSWRVGAPSPSGWFPLRHLQRGGPRRRRRELGRRSPPRRRLYAARLHQPNGLFHRATVHRPPGAGGNGPRTPTCRSSRRSCPPTIRIWRRRSTSTAESSRSCAPAWATCSMRGRRASRRPPATSRLPRPVRDERRPPPTRGSVGDGAGSGPWGSRDRGWIAMANARPACG